MGFFVGIKPLKGKLFQQGSRKQPRKGLGAWYGHVFFHHQDVYRRVPLIPILGTYF